MRRIVRDRVATSIERAKPELEDYIATRLQYPAAFPYLLGEPLISIREMRSVRITPTMKADYPPVDIDATMRASLAARTRHLLEDPRLLVLDVDLRLLARGTVRGDGSYDIAPQSAMVMAWWRGMDPER